MLWENPLSMTADGSANNVIDDRLETEGKGLESIHLLVLVRRDEKE